jgi:putative transposase
LEEIKGGGLNDSELTTSETDLMPRSRPANEAGGFYHVLNRGHDRSQIFWTDDDDSALEPILAEWLAEYDVSVFSFPLMPNHWHLVLRPNVDGEELRGHGRT